MWLPLVLVGALVLLSGLMAIYLPETLNRPLPETVEEVEGFTRKLMRPQDIDTDATRELAVEEGGYSEPTKF